MSSITKPSIQRNGKAEVLGPAPTNDAATLIAFQLPYAVEFTIQGVCPIIFHRWSNESVAEKSAAKKGSAAKKSDDLESYVYRDDDGFICIPGSYVHASLSSKKEGAGRYFQDPRSPRKSAADLYKAAAIPTTLLAPIINASGKKTKSWDALDERRMVVQQSAVARQRPCFNAGWRATFRFEITLPEYVGEQDFLAVLSLAGRAVGVADSRPTYGRFQVIEFKVV
jgi:hypothetical protein